jgi:hypothetical protein
VSVWLPETDTAEVPASGGGGSNCCSCAWVVSISGTSSGKGYVVAIREPGLRIGNSNSGSLAGMAMPEPGVRMGNSSSSGFGIGIGPDIRPRIDDWWPVVGRPALEVDFHKPGIVSLSLPPTYTLRVLERRSGVLKDRREGKERSEDDGRVRMVDMGDSHRSIGLVGELIWRLPD